MIGNTTTLTTPAESIPSATLYIPLQFWFCRNPGLALPLIALQYHEVKFNIQFADASQCYITSDNNVPASGTPVIGDASLWIDYVYLDTDERRQFAQVQHEYLLHKEINNKTLVNYIFTTLSNCGKLLRAIITLLYSKQYNIRHNIMDWTIRSMYSSQNTIQRLNVSGE